MSGRTGSICRRRTIQKPKYEITGKLGSSMKSSRSESSSLERAELSSIAAIGLNTIRVQIGCDFCIEQS